MRRADKEIKEQAEIEEVLQKNNIVTLAMIDDGVPYSLPISYGYKDRALYLHSAAEGRKIDVLKHNNRVSFSIYDSVSIVTGDKGCDYGCHYRSVVGEGNVFFISDRDEKIEALSHLMKQYTGQKQWEYSEKMVEVIAVMRIDIDMITGKKS